MYNINFIKSCTDPQEGCSQTGTPSRKRRREMTPDTPRKRKKRELPSTPIRNVLQMSVVERSPAVVVSLHVTIEYSS